MLRMPKCAPTSAEEAEFVKKFEYVMVFPLVESKDNKKSTVEGVEYSDVNDNTGKESPECRFMIQTMESKGLELFMYNSVQDDELYVLIHAPVSYGLFKCTFFDVFFRIIYWKVMLITSIMSSVWMMPSWRSLSRKAIETDRSLQSWSPTMSLSLHGSHTNSVSSMSAVNTFLFYFSIFSLCQIRIKSWISPPRDVFATTGWQILLFYQW